MKKKSISFFLVVCIFVLISIIAGCGKESSDYTLVFGDDFSDGVAWIVGVDKDDQRFVGVVDTSGKLLFKVDDAYVPERFVNTDDANAFLENDWHSRFVNGTAYYLLDDRKTYALISKEGEILKTIEEDLQFSHISADHYFVMQEPTGYEKANRKIGVLDSKGQWSVELHEEKKSESESDEDLETSFGNNLQRIEYLGEGIYCNFDVYYDANANQYFTLEVPSVEPSISKGDFENTINSTPVTAYYYNQKFFVTYNKSYIMGDATRFFIYNKAGKFEKEITFNSSVMRDNEKFEKFQFSDGVAYYYDTKRIDDLDKVTTGDSLRMNKKYNERAHRGVIFDMEGNVLYNLSNLSDSIAIKDLCDPKGGYVGLKIEGNDGEYFTIMQNDGTFCFEPRKTTYVSSDFGLDCCILSSENNSYDFINCKGEVQNNIENSIIHFDRKFYEGLMYSGDGTLKIEGYYNAKGDFVFGKKEGY